MKILIIDDDADVRDIFHARLEQAGYEVLEAENGEEGFQTALQGGIDLILLDIMMPKKDGWQVCKAVKSHPKMKNIPVIILTAKNQEIEELRSWESGVDEFLPKPVDHQVLLETIKKLLDRKGEEKS